jgi:hypothetical protein
MYYKITYWLPRALAILYILFLALFALDVFNGESPWQEQALGFLIHLIPTFVLLLVLLVAWKYELVGGALFLALSVLMWSLLNNPFLVNLMLVGPALLVGSLFSLSYWLKRGSLVSL